jgi:thiol-disulfide isomerase/thioredoxin
VFRSTIVTYKRSLLLAIAFLGILHYYRSALSQSSTKIIKQGSDTSSSFLYPSNEAHPYVLDYNTNEYDFTKTKTPKVIEFYDPKCGACQAFKYNYIEVAKKVIEERPNVQFYGVSCEVYRSVCDLYSVKRFPKIIVFPNGDVSNGDEGIEVPKGTGTIYFLSARLLKALRTKEEIDMDASKLSAGT